MKDFIQFLTYFFIIFLCILVLGFTGIAMNKLGCVGHVSGSQVIVMGNSITCR